MHFGKTISSVQGLGVVAITTSQISIIGWIGHQHPRVGGTKLKNH